MGEVTSDTGASGLPKVCPCGYEFAPDEARYMTDESIQCSVCFIREREGKMSSEHELIEPWRTLGTPERMQFILYVQEGMTKRQIQGRETYGDTFQGDPLTHLEEELMDALFYVWMTRKQRGQEQERITEDTVSGRARTDFEDAKRN